MAEANNFHFLDDNDYVTTPELAAVLGTTRQKIGDLIRDGKLSAQARNEGRGRPYQIRVGDARKVFPQLRDGGAA